MIFVTRSSTVFRIRRRHRSDEALEIVPRDYAGVMGADRDASYDAHAFDGVRQSKCVAHLFRSLDDPAVKPTNNSAERALRPAVIARKVSHCSRNDRGANACATFKTIAVTARQRGIMPQQAILAILKN